MIQVDGLTKFYGDKRALKGLAFSIERGEIVGLLGLNGAGKTTALKILGCLTLPSSGRVVVDGFDVVEAPHEIRKRVGFLPETPPLYGEMRVHEFLTFAARLRGISGGEAVGKVEEVVKKTNLAEVRNELIMNLSHGFRQRVGIAQAMVHNPALLILDEPTSGLDPVQIIEVRELIRSLKGQHTILVSSHILSEISQTCDRILVIQQGEIIAQGTETELASRVAATFSAEVDVAGDVGRLPEALKRLDGVVRVEVVKKDDAGTTLRVDMKSDVRGEVAKAVVGSGAALLRLDRAGGGLESIFLKLIQGGRA
jgi:ABC-2 type transport system ATP-binding protein